MQHSRARPSVPKAIVPAIPLPYIQKRMQQVVAREKAKEDAQAAPAVQQLSSAAPPQTVAEPAVANGSYVEHGDNKHKQVSKEASNAPEQVLLPAVNSNAGEPREIANEESMAQGHEKIAGMMNSLSLKWLSI